MAESSSVMVQRCLDRLRAGDGEANADLFKGAGDRLRRLAVRMLDGSAKVGRWEQADDVLQNALLRLHRALGEVQPATVRDFFHFASVQIRRELIDLARHYYGVEGVGANHASNVGDSRSGAFAPTMAHSDSNDPSRLLLWTEFHEQINALPDDDREAFELLWYQGLNQAEAAELLGVSVRTLQRRWTSAC